MFTKPQKHIHTIVNRGDMLLILIPTPTVSIKLLPWGGFILISLGMAATTGLVWLAGLPIFAILLILWHFYRQEVVEVRSSSITLVYDVLGVRLRSKRYLADNIIDLRELVANPKGLVAFDYGSSTIIFGEGLEAAGAAEVVAKIKHRFPQYQRDRSYARAHSEHPIEGAPSPNRFSKGIRAPLPRCKFEVLGDTIRITIPSIKKWAEIIFLIFWLTFWSIGGHFVIQIVSQSVEQGSVSELDWFLVFWLIFWMIMEVLGVYHLLWLMVGKEEIEISSNSIAIRHTILGIGRFKVFFSEDICGIRIDPTVRIEPYSLAEEGINLNKGSGMITFDYRKKMISMGIGIEEAEAKELVARIQEQYPQYAARNERQYKEFIWKQDGNEK